MNRELETTAVAVSDGGRFRVSGLDSYRSLQVYVLETALELLATTRMPRRSVRAARLLVPYCAQELSWKHRPSPIEGRLILLNRAYKPLGMGGVYVHYEAEERWHIPASFAAHLDLLEHGYFFNDLTAPWRSSNKRLRTAIEQLIQLIKSTSYPWFPGEMRGPDNV